MEQVRLFLAFVLSFLVLVLWNYFFVIPQQEPRNEQPPASRTAETEAPASRTSELTPEDPQTVDDTLATAPSAELDAPEEMPVAPPIPAARPVRTFVVESSKYRIALTETGAAFEKFVLKDYREAAAEDAPLKALITEDAGIRTVLAGFTEAGLPDLANVNFTADLDAERLDVYDENETVSFLWRSPRGIEVEKRYTFQPDSYLIELDIFIRNSSAQPVRGNLILALRDKSPDTVERFGFSGPSGLISGEMERIRMKDLPEKNRFSGTVQWLALERRYFMSSLLPRDGAEGRMELARLSGDVVENAFVLPDRTIPPDGEDTYEFNLYFGPKSLKVLNRHDNQLSRVVDFGWFDFIAKPCLWLMNRIYAIIPNYGVAIVLLTVLIKLLLWPLGNKSYQSMSEMKRLQPLMQEIREKYADDKQKMNEELMNLYRIYKVNPLGGCLPMVLQIPVFIALYNMLYEAIELRHAPFFGWINDLSAPDRLFNFGIPIPFMEPPYGIPVLTLVMGATMFLQQKMSPPPGDPAQAKMMMIMPLVLTVIFINFSSGLVLYWLVNNILSILQQYYVSKKYN